MSELIRDGPVGEYRVDHSAAEQTVLYLCHKISPTRPDQGLVHIPKQQTGSSVTSP